MPRTIAITTVFNEERTVISVLNDIANYADAVIVVNDGSQDSSREKIERWKEARDNIYFISMRENRGQSQALKRAYALIKYLLEKRKLSPEDLVVELDSDGQHDPNYIRALCGRKLGNPSVDIVLARRDFSFYPRYKVWGNRLLTLIASLLSGKRYEDVESNYRVMEAQLYLPLLDYFLGHRYSGAFETGIITGLLGYTTDNSLVVKTPCYRAGARAFDALHVLACGLWAWTRVKLKARSNDLDSLTSMALAEWTDGHR